MAELPSFEDLRRLIVSRPKPPVRATVAELTGGKVTRRANVVHDGDTLWWIETRGKRELSEDDAAVIVDRSGMTAFSVHVASNLWVKPLFQGRLISALEQPASGDVLGVEEFLGRSCYVADIRGLRMDEDAVFRLWVDRETGFILKERRDDIHVELEVEKIEIGRREG